MRLLLGLLFIVQSVKAVESQQSPTIKSEQNIRLGLNWKPEPEFGGFYCAKSKNWLGDLKILEGGAGTPTIQMVASGQIEFGVVGGEELLLARARGADLVALYAVFQKHPMGIMVRKTSPFQTLEQLFKSNSTIAMEKGLPYSLYLEKKYGFKSVHVVPYTGGITHFLLDPNFAQQGFAGSEPLLAEDKNIPARMLLLADEGFNPYTTVLVAKASLLKQNPGLVKTIVDGVDRGWQEYLKNPNPTHKLMHDLNPSISADQMDRTLKIQRTLIMPDPKTKNRLGQMTLERWELLAKQLYDLKLTNSKVDVSKAFVNPH